MENNEDASANDKDKDTEPDPFRRGHLCMSCLVWSLHKDSRPILISRAIYVYAEIFFVCLFSQLEN